MRPLFLAPARPTKVEWNNSPYLGVFPFVFKARNRAFSAPKIWMVEAGNFARFVNEPACEINRAPTCSPKSVAKFGATSPILDLKYSASSFLYSESATTLLANISMFNRSITLISMPILDLAASRIAWAFAESIVISSRPSKDASLKSLRFLMNFVNLA